MLLSYLIRCETIVMHNLSKAVFQTENMLDWCGTTTVGQKEDKDSSEWCFQYALVKSTTAFFKFHARCSSFWKNALWNGLRIRITAYAIRRFASSWCKHGRQHRANDNAEQKQMDSVEFQTWLLKLTFKLHHYSFCCICLMIVDRVGTVCQTQH